MSTRFATGLRRSLIATLLAHAPFAAAQAIDDATVKALEARAEAVQPKMVAWRRDIHQHPELSGQETRTAALVAEHLRKLGLKVQTGVGGTGVVGVLEGGLPGKVVALRADMDALPVAENSNLPFASKVTQINMGKESPVMHACGHDGHTAMLMGAAEVLAGMRDKIPGTVKFIFQPAEEGVSSEAMMKASWGARAMIEAGALQNPKVDAAFSLHIIPNAPAGVIGYRSGPIWASSDVMRIKVTGKQTHGAFPWNGVDPIVVSAQIVNALQTVVSRQLNISKEPAVVTIGQINGGTRNNIIPEAVEMAGTLRAFDEDMRSAAKEKIVRAAESIAAANGAKAEVVFEPGGYSVTVNDDALNTAMGPALSKLTNNRALPTPKMMASEDFSEFAKAVPSLYLTLGAPPAGKTPLTAAPNHNPAFDFDEGMMPLGARTMAGVALEFLSRN